MQTNPQVNETNFLRHTLARRAASSLACAAAAFNLAISSSAEDIRRLDVACRWAVDTENVLGEKALDCSTDEANKARAARIGNFIFDRVALECFGKINKI